MRHTNSPGLRLCLWVMLSLGVIIFCLSSVSASSCYQESANTSNQVGTDGSCGLNYSGSYQITSNYMYINYTKPISSNNASLWRVKFGGNTENSFFYNDFSILASCWNYNSNIILLRVYTTDNASDCINPMVESSYGQCFNGTWNTITNVSYASVTGGMFANSQVGAELRLFDGDYNSQAVYQDDYCFNHHRWVRLTLNTGFTNYSGVVYEEAMIWNVSDFAIGNVSYTPTTSETTTENYNIIYAGINLISTSAILNYNGTAYPSTTNCASSLCTSTNTINLPSQVAAQLNNSFYWTITTYNGTDSSTYNSSIYNQTVNAITLTKCTSGSIVLNFTAYDEQNKTRISPFDFEGNFQYSTSIGGTKKTLSISNSSAKEVDLCINKNTTYYIDAIIAYNQGDYPVRNWFYQNYPINNITQNINLYSLNTTSSTSFIFQVQDEHVQPVKQVLVNVQRCYPGINTNETVFISRTDSNGLTTGNLEAETALYQFYITNQSQTLLAVTPCAKVIPQTSPYTIIFNLGGAYVSPVTNINNLSNIASSIVFNNSNGLLTWTYTDTSGRFNSSELIVSNLNMSGNNNVVCDTTGSLSSQILTCNITAAGTYSAKVYIYRDNQILIDQTVFTFENRSSTAGYYGVFLAFFLILISAFAFKFNEIAGIVLMNVVIIFVNIVGLVNFGVIAITAILGISIFIIGVLER